MEEDLGGVDKEDALEEDDNLLLDESPDRAAHLSGRKNNTALGKRLRQENGLVELTKKFIQLIKEAPEQCVDLNDAVGRLEVQKRRIYDITNVLEGIGLIAKYKKNKIRWAGTDQVRRGGAGSSTSASQANKRPKRVEEDNELAQEALKLRQQLQELQEHGRELDRHLINLQNHRENLMHDENYARYAYVTYEDLELLNNASFYKDQGLTSSDEASYANHSS